MAIGAMRALRDLRLDVPGDVSVVGFDDIDLAPHVDPPLTTVHQPIRRQGRGGGPAAARRHRTGPGQPPSIGRLETRLIVRGSTGPVPASGRGGGRGPTTEIERRAAPSPVRARQRTYRPRTAHRADHRPACRPTGRPSGDQIVDRTGRSRQEDEDNELRCRSTFAGARHRGRGGGQSPQPASPAATTAAPHAPRRPHRTGDSGARASEAPGRPERRGHPLALLRLGRR